MSETSESHLDFLAAERHCWDVQIFKGAQDVSADGPVAFGVPQVVVGDQGSLGDPTVPLVYSAVGVRTVETWACIERISWHSAENVIGYPPGSHYSQNKIFREMAHVSRVDFTDEPSIRIVGMEERADGALVTAIWSVTPHVDDDDA